MPRKPRNMKETRPDYANDSITVSATEFKARCLELIEQIQQTRREITVTRYGKPVARLMPIDAEKPSAWGWMSDQGDVVMGDLISPIDVEWEANE